MITILPSMPIALLSDYHQEKMARTKERSEQVLQGKKKELKHVFDVLRYDNTNDRIKVAVLGCADPRHIEGHKRIFRELLEKDVEIVTFDITTDHLSKREEVIKHDVSNALPYGPFDIIFSHVLLKFVEPKRKMLVIKETFSALNIDGLGIHVIGVGTRHTENDPTNEEVMEYCKKLNIPCEVIKLPTRGYAIFNKKI